MPTRLLYVADPMCSWCWGFAPVLAEVEARLPSDVTVELVLGGLAPDSDEPMDEPTRQYVQNAWRAVEARTGASFNHAFWERHSPRRSTWPACRAVLAAGERARPMFSAIQRAYYVEARDPSDKATLVEIAGELDLDPLAFERDLDSPATRARLEEHFALRNGLGVRGYPSLALVTDEHARVLSRGWVDTATIALALDEALSRSS